MEPIKPDFSEANKFAVLKRGFRDEFDKAYNNFWKRRNMEAPDTSWFGDRKKRKEEMK
tara:strand:+ start:217 stop:390 length:174 start_codon:yes stop_codon:yes gene_type:complete